MRIPKKVFIGAAGMLVAVGAFMALFSITGLNSNAMTVTTRKDCGYTDTIVDCGTVSTSELLDVYDKNNDRRGNRDIQAIFHHYGIYRSDITGSTSTVKKGWLNTNGTIVVDGVTVADGAKSLYRVHPGKQVSPVSIAGKTYYIGPVAGNYGLGADLFVYFNKDGTFKAAIQASCGNPIVATNKVTPPPKPVYACESLSATKIDRTRFRFSTTASARNGAEIVSYNYDFGDGTRTTGGQTIEHTYARPGTYTTTVTVNVRVDGKTVVVPGANCQTTVKVDEEPKNPAYACELLKAVKIDRTRYRFEVTASASNGAEIVSYTYTFGDGKTETSPNRTIEHTYAEPGTYFAGVVVNVRVDGKMVTVPGANCKATVRIEEEPKVPVYKCESLKAQKLERDRFRFTATATAENATIVNYTFDFGDGAKRTVPTATTEYEYARPGTYTATVTVNVRVNGELKVAPGNHCKVTITVDEEPEKPVYKCDLLTAELIKDRTFAYTLEYTAGGGAELDRVVYNFGDGNSQTYSAASATNVEYTYAQAGNYTTTATLYFNVPDGDKTVEKRATCKVKIAIEKPIEVCDLTDNTIKTIKQSEFDESHMTTDLEKCAELKVCIIEDKVVKVIAKHEYNETTMTTDMSKCEEVETPPELPRTGIDTLIGGSIGIGSIAAAGHYWVASRRSLLSALLNR